MHFIQKHILKQLSQHTTRRYSELQLRRVESNKFTYHLQKLIAHGYIKKVPNGYALTNKGVHHSTSVHFEDFSVRIQPKIVTLIVCRNRAGEYLMYRRAKQPFLHMIGFPYGKIHLGETAQEAASRELIEKTGTAATLEQKGIVYLLVTGISGEIITHMLCHVFFGSDPHKVGVPQPTGFGTTEWLPARELTSLACMPGVADVLRIATSRTKTLAFEELSFVYAAEQ